MTTTQAPTYLSGHLAPVPDEIDAVDLPVDGVLPPELTGRYLRNGPNPLPGEDPGHWFTGHGMLHGVRLRDGRAEWYRNRWVRTGELAGDPFVHSDGTFDRAAVSANTHVLEHGGRLLALVENGFPYEVTRELDTVGPCDFGGRLTTAMTAHPKCDPDTGELHFFGYSAMAPHLDLPVTFRFDLLGHGMPYAWDDAYAARIGIMELDRPGHVRWFEIDPCYVFHLGSAHTDAQGRIVLDGARYSAAYTVQMWSGLGGATPAADAAALGVARLHRWVLDPATGSVSETARDDRSVEFPTLDDRLVGRSSRYLYAVSEASIVKYDDVSGAVDTHALDAGTAAGEAVFVPAQGGTSEDDGWLLTITTRTDGSASQLLVLDAHDVGGPAVAAVTLPRGVPAGFHGSWIED